MGSAESSEDFAVVGIGEGDGIKVVGVHKLLEDVGAEDHRLRNHHRGIVEAVDRGMALDDVVDESQTAAFSTQRAFTDTGKVGVLVEAVAFEHRHHALVLHAAVAHDGVKDDLSVGIKVLQLIPREGADEFGQRKHGAAAQPARHVVARDVVEQRLGGHFENGGLQFFERPHPRHRFEGRGVAEDEVAEAEVHLDGIAQIDVHLLRIFVDEVRSINRCAVHVLRLGRLEDERQEGVACPEFGQKFHTRSRIDLSGFGIARVGDDAKHLLGVVLVEGKGLLVVARQHNLRPTAHAQGALVAVEGFGGKILALLEYKFVEFRQHRGVEADAVLHEENHLHTAFLDVVIEVHFVLNEFDNREEEVGVAQPAEDVFEDAQVLVLHTRGDAVTEGREHHEGDGGVALFDGAGDVEGFAVVRARHDDDEVERCALQFAPRFFGRGGQHEARRIAQRECGIFVEEFLVNAPIVLQHEGIVGVGQDEDVEHAARHQIDERSVFQKNLIELLFGQHSGGN